MSGFRNILLPAFEEKSAAGLPLYSLTNNKSYSRVAGYSALLGMFAVGLSLGISGCGSNSRPFTTGTSEGGGLAVNPSAIDFGAVDVGDVAHQSVSITNKGTTSVQIAQLSSSNSAFTVVAGALPSSLPAGGSVDVEVTYKPGSTTDSTGQLSVDAKTSSSTSLQGMVKLHGKGAQASLSALSCANSSMTGPGPDSCTVKLSAPAPSGGVAVTMTSSSSAVTVPSSIPVPAGTTGVTFTATVSAVSSTQTVTLTAKQGSASKSASIQVSGSASSELTPSVSGISCANNSFTGAATTSCTVSLTSGAPSAGLGVTLTSNNSAVKVPSSVTVPSGATTVSFSATISSVSTSQTATVSASANSSSQSVGLQLNAATPGVTVSTTSLAFGNVAVGSAITKPVTVTSSGTVAVTINSDSITGTGFTVTGGGFPATLNPGQSTVLTVQFLPTTASSVSGQLSILSTGPTATVNVSGSGTAVMPTVSAISCGSTSITGSLADSCTVSLSGAAPTGGVSVGLASSSGSVTLPSSVTVPATATSTSFTANVASVTTAQSATLTASTGSTSKSVSLQLNAATAALSLSATSLSFGNVAVGTAVTKSVTVTSSGTAAVTINSDSTTGTGFTVSGGSFPATLNPGQATVLTVQFYPTTANSVSGQLSISSDAPTATVNLSGTGTAVTPTVSSVSCSSTSITGSLADSCSVSLSGSAPTGGVSVGLASSNGSVTLPGSVTVPATATSASFTANVASVSSAQSATITATTGSTSKTVSLQLNAASPALSLNATTVSFGSVVVNNPTTQTVTLTSSGTGPVTVNSVTVTGSGFSASPTSLPATLNPGQAMSVTLTFDPTAVGSATGQLTVNSNSSTNPTATVGLSGSGAPHEVDLSWVAPSGSSDPIAGYNVYRAPSGTGSFAMLNSANTQTAYTDTSVQAGQAYDYYVTSVDSSGVESAPSNMTTVTIP